MSQRFLVKTLSRLSEWSTCLLVSVNYSALLRQAGVGLKGN